MDENELCKVGDFGLLRETSKREEDGENLYILQVSFMFPLLTNKLHNSLKLQLVF